ncbi:conserved hypothetical protein [Coccidioides posadasii str. Silveira]|uniref:Uncharacterized protein n=1 Tax=Coccidioides posadasii (strain RMSCC 757 / Silveira) TaxID=443226 RepID=E9DCQ3_COCPS|nr:conserved hypothetical protein [Coccidioides posadasii str. Silveira]
MDRGSGEPASSTARESDRGGYYYRFHCAGVAQPEAKPHDWPTGVAEKSDARSLARLYWWISGCPPVIYLDYIMATGK